MYLDNILVAKSEDSSVSYAEILMDSIEVNETIQASEVQAISSEFASHTLGSEAVSDWWPKIKAFFKKIWESLKRLFAKVVAWIASLPNKIIALCKKIYMMWVKRGIDGKMKNLRKNLQKKIIGLNPQLAKEFEETDWGMQDPLSISSQFDALVNKAKPENPVTKILVGQFQREVIKGLIEAGAKQYAAAMSDEDSVSTVKEDMKDFCDKLREMIEDATEGDYRGKYKDILANLESWYLDVKNDTYSKQFKNISRGIEITIEIMDRMHEKAYKEFETLYKNDDEEGAKDLTLQLKCINLITQACIYGEGFFAKLFATAALNRAKMVVAAMKCFDAEGAKSGGTSLSPAASADGGVTEIIKNPSNQKQNPANTKKSGGSNSGSKPAKRDFTKPMSAEDMLNPGAFSPMPKSVANDPEFAAFMKM